MLHVSKTHCRGVACVVVLLTLLFLCPAHAAAIPVAEYQARLKQVVDDLVKLAHVDKDWDDADFQKRVLQTIDSIDVALP